MNHLNISTLILGILALSSAAVNAAGNGSAEGPYVGASLGRASFGANDLGLPKAASDESGIGGKVYAGYRLTDHLGVEAGYARLGSVRETLKVGTGDVAQSAAARSLYLAATGRMPVGQGISLLGKLGVSFGRVSGTNLLPAAADITGSKRSLMYGIGAEYALSSKVALTVDFDHFGNLSDRVRGNMLGAGLRYSF